MRNLILTLIALLAFAPSLSATEAAPVEVPPRVASTAPTKPAIDESELQLRKVAVEERQSSSDVATAQLGPRGGFWWTVGAIVVAVLIVSVIL